MNLFQKMIVPRIKKVLTNRWFFRLVGIGIFILILYQITWIEFLRIIKQVNPYWILISLALQGIALLVTTLRWLMIMKRFDIHVSYSLSLTHQLIGTGMAMVTPGQLGEFIKVLYHRSLGYPVPESVLSVLMDRLFDLLMLMGFGFLSLAFLFGLKASFILEAIVITTLLALASLLFFRNKKKGTNWFASLLDRFSPKPYKAVVKQNIQQLVGEVESMSLVFIVICTLLSLFNYALLVVKVYVLALSVHISIPFWYFASAVPLFRLAGLLPISVSGIGSRDAVIIYLLSRAGISTESSLIFSLLGFIILEFQALIGMLVWWRCPPTLKSGNGLFQGTLYGIEEIT